MIRRLLREPLLHFVLLGAALFGAYRWLNPAGVGSAGEIVVTSGKLRNLTETWARAWQRPPTPEELGGLVEDYVREEVLYREAVALGLDRDDTVVRRRMRQKLEFLSEDSAANAAAPTEAELAAWLAAHPDTYRVEPRVSFRQVYLDPQRRGKALEADAAALLAALRTRADRVDLSTAGDSLMLEPRYADQSEADVGQLFGSGFEAALRDAPVGEWFGPLTSGYGAHLVLIERRTPGGEAALAAVRDQVERDFEAGRRQALLDAQYQALRRQYTIRIEGQ
jgi:hypothetical protein